MRHRRVLYSGEDGPVSVMTTILPESTVPFPVAPGVFAGTGPGAVLAFATPPIVLPAGPGLFARIGLDVGLSRAAPTVLRAGPGRVALSGTAATVTKLRTFRAGAGRFAGSGVAARLVKGRHPK
jgi:hypothetical protein